MAFNPFANFRKYQKFWMATILLVTMFTFVLCTGAGQGDLSDILIRVFRPRGTPYAAIDGRKVYGSEFHDLKERRNAANDFMRKAGKVVVAQMDDKLKPENLKKLDDPNARKAIQEVYRMRENIDLRVRRPRFFGETGVKVDELLDFKVWLAEADRLKIHLTDDGVRRLAEALLGGESWLHGQAWGAALYEARGHNPRINDAVMIDILRDEFRVQLAQRVLGYGGATRLAVTPGQMWEYYKEKRVEYREALLPLHAEDFVAKIPEPSDAELQIFFDQYRTVPYDPASDKIGFAQPSQAKVAWISGDPASTYFKDLSKLALQLQTTPPLPGPEMAAWQFIGAGLAKARATQDVFDSMRGRFFSSSISEGGAALNIAEYLIQKDPLAASAMFLAGVRSDAGIAALPSFLSVGMLDEKRHKKKFDAGALVEFKKRAPIYAVLPLLGATHQGLAIPGVWDALRQPSFLPVDVVQDELLEILERKQGRAWVQTHMRALKTQLERPNITTRVGVERTIEKYVEDRFKYLGEKVAHTKTLKDLGLEMAETKDLYSKYSVQDAKELEPLRKSFSATITTINSIEGRSSVPDTVLKDDDFWKMFFGDERFSATGRLYEVKSWPPAVTVYSQIVQQARLIPENPQLEQIAKLAENVEAHQPVVMQLFPDAERPFLFWRTKDEPPLVPQELGQVRKLVVNAWKLNKARETILLPRAQKIADAIVKSANPNGALEDAHKALNEEYKLKREIIPLAQVTPLVPQAHGGQFGAGQRDYREFSLPPGLFPYPRKDMAADLLGLYDLKKAIEIGYGQVDDINKTLYNQVSKDKSPQGKYVQVLSNQPRTVFYIAIVRGEHVSHIDFNIATQEALRNDSLYDIGRGDAAKRMREDFMRHLRTVVHKVEEPSPEVRKSFDSDVVN